MVNPRPARWSPDGRWGGNRCFGGRVAVNIGNWNHNGRMCFSLHIYLGPSYSLRVLTNNPPQTQAAERGKEKRETDYDWKLGPSSSYVCERSSMRKPDW